MSKRSLLALAEGVTLARSDTPIAHARPVIAVVDRMSPRWVADALAQVLDARGVRVARLTTTLRTTEGAEKDAGHVRASPDAMRGALTEALAALGAHDVLIAEGTAAVALLDARLAILATTGTPLSLPPDVRALRSAFDLVLYAERPAAIERVADRLMDAVLQGQAGA